MIDIDKLSYKYKNGGNVLENIRLQIKEGEIVSIIGKNGSGKSTLARLIAGITKQAEGTIFIDGIDTRNKEEAINLRKKIRNCVSKS